MASWTPDPVWTLADGTHVLCLKRERGTATPETDYQAADALARRTLFGATLYAKGDSDGTVRRLYYSHS